MRDETMNQAPESKAEATLEPGKVLSPDQAKKECQRFLDEWEIEINMNAMNEDTQEDFESFKIRLANALERGRLSIDEDGDPHMHLRNPVGTLTDIHFHLPDAPVFRAFDEYKEGKNIAKSFKVIAAMCKISDGEINRFDGRDIKICQNVFQLFFVS